MRDSITRSRSCPISSKTHATLLTKEAAHYVGLSARMLEKHRTHGTGPAYKTIGGRVVYTLQELRAWADSGSCASTSDPNNANVSPPVRRKVGTCVDGQGNGDVRSFLSYWTAADR